MLKTSTSLLLLAATAAVLVAHPDDAPGAPAPTPLHAGPCPTGSAAIDLVGPADVGLVCSGETCPADPGEVFAAAQSLAGGAVLTFEPVAPDGPAAGEGLWRAAGDPEAVGRLVRALQGDRRVEVAECEIEYRALAEPVAAPREWTPNDPLLERQWHMRLAGAPAAWAESRRLGKGAIVAVVDTGVAQVPDLDPDRLLVGRTFGEGLPEGRDDHGHGTHVAGTIAQWTNNGEGVAGVAPRAELLPIKVLSADGGGSLSDVAAGIYEAAGRGAHVMNLSLGSDHPSRLVAKAVAEARAAGTVVAAAAGNNGGGRVGYPAADPGAFAVGSVGPEGKRSRFGQYGKALDISAPGGDMRTQDDAGRGVLQNTILDGDPDQSGYLAWQGTSMATPHVAGAAALLAAAGVTRPAEVEALLRETARPAPGGKAGKRSDEYGAGLLDAGAALRAARDRYTGERGVLCLALGLALLAAVAPQIRSLRNRAAVARVAVEAAIAGVAAAWIAGAFGQQPLEAIAELLGFAADGSPLVWSALLAAAAVAALPRPLHAVGAGVALGCAAWLLHGAAALPCLLRDLPGGAWLDRGWLLLHAGIAAALALLATRAHLRRFLPAAPTPTPAA